MLCDKCKKRTATVRFEKIINNEVTTANLCGECASDEGLQLDFNSFLNGLIIPILNEKKASSNTLNCNVCSMEFSEFKALGKFGCSECYKYFEPNTEAILKSIQGNASYAGKIPKRAGVDISKERELAQLKSSLQKAIESEEFEQAAVIRDKIKAFQGLN